MTAAPAEARCFTHPEVLATGACARCGVFFCADDRALVDLVSYCRTCATRPDVDWIEAYRQKYGDSQWVDGVLKPHTLEATLRLEPA